MTFERKGFTWEVQLQPPSGEVITEKVTSFWSPDFEGVKDAIAIAARCKAWIRNKKKVEFVAIGDPKLVKN